MFFKSISLVPKEIKFKGGFFPGFPNISIRKTEKRRFSVLHNICFKLVKPCLKKHFTVCKSWGNYMEAFFSLFHFFLKKIGKKKPSEKTNTNFPLIFFQLFTEAVILLPYKERYCKNHMSLKPCFWNTDLERESGLEICCFSKGSFLDLMTAFEISMQETCSTELLFSSLVCQMHIGRFLKNRLFFHNIGTLF